MINGELCTATDKITPSQVIKDRTHGCDLGADLSSFDKTLPSNDLAHSN